MEANRLMSLIADPAVPLEAIVLEFSEYRRHAQALADGMLSEVLRHGETLDPLSASRLAELKMSCGPDLLIAGPTRAAKTVVHGLGAVNAHATALRAREAPSGSTPGVPDAATVLRRDVKSTIGKPPGTMLRSAVGTPDVDGHPSLAELELGEGSIVHDWYRLERLLGFGAMGQVWKAKDLQRERANDPQPYVALKLVSADFAQHREAMVLMAREAKKGQELAHPNIATVYVFAVDPHTGQAYLAMELLEGTPLDRLIKEHRTGLPRKRALDIVRGLARGLAYAHSKGIVHCDFKPGNAFVTDAGVPKVLDFGIARLANEVARAGDNFDAGALNALTPPYASLEMLADPPPQPDPSDDVYALGLVAYELLSGRHPFGGANAVEVMATGRRPRPIKGLRRREWHAVERALRLHRAERYVDAQAFLKAMEGVSPWTPALGALAVVLAMTSGYVGYRNYQASKPAPFGQLPVEVQQDFRSAMTEGDHVFRGAMELLSGTEQTQTVYRDAIPRYAEAYSLHPRNPEADAALRRALDVLRDRLEAERPEVRQEARAILEDLRTQYRTLASYEPLNHLIDELG